MVRGFQKPGLIRLAVVVGGHPYNVPAFRALFDSLTGVDYFIQELDTWSVDKWSGQVWDQYDVHLFYDMHAHSPGHVSVRKDMDAPIAAAVERLGQTEQGVLVWHHALLNFVQWRSNEAWSRICNVADRHLRSYHPNTEMMTTIADRDHPITRGLSDWKRVDETFVIDEPGPESTVLLSTDHPQSMKALGWVHTCGVARVFCLQPGHDKQAYTDPTFQTILQRGIEWLAHKI